MAETVSMQFVGDLILDEPNPNTLFNLAHARLQDCDLLVGHVEVPHSSRGQQMQFDIPAPPSDPAHLAALTRAGFHIVTLAGNHIADAGPNGVEDTVAELRRLGITTTGAGMNLAEARRPALAERKGLRIGVLSYNCVGPRESWAGEACAGCAYVEIISGADARTLSPGEYSLDGARAEPRSGAAMLADIEALRPQVDVLAVALHKGLGHTPATVAAYERQIARSAIDAGADIVWGHHAHILQGMEVYRGRPIVHGLGNFAIATRALSLEDNPSPARLAWARRRRELFGFEPDPDYPTYPFHPEAKNAIIGFCEADAQGIVTAGFFPCFVNRHSQPEVLGNDLRGRAVADYVRDITIRAGLNAEFEWDADRVLFYRRNT